MIAFSGGTSHYGILNHDDIDLFIITKPNAVYIVYLMIHLYAFLARARKELCANYLIDETGMKIRHSIDLYTAHKIVPLNPFKNSRMLIKFINENEWIKKFFPNFNIKYANLVEQPSKNYLLKPLNIALMLMYKIWYRRKIISSTGTGSLVLKQNCLKLHTNDHRVKILSEFQSRLNEYYSAKETENDSQTNKELVEVGT